MNQPNVEATALRYAAAALLPIDAPTYLTIGPIGNHDEPPFSIGARGYTKMAAAAILNRDQAAPGLAARFRADLVDLLHIYADEIDAFGAVKPRTANAERPPLSSAD